VLQHAVLDGLQVIGEVALAGADGDVKTLHVRRDIGGGEPRGRRVQRQLVRLQLGVDGRQE